MGLKKKISQSLFLVAVMLLLNCGIEQQSLEIGLTPDKVFFLPTGIEFEDDSCYDDQTIAASLIKITSITTRWTSSTTSFTPVVLQISFAGRDGVVADYECNVIGKASSSLGSFLNLGGSSYTAVGGVTDKTSTCAIVCGGIQILDEETSFAVTAKVKLVGVETKEDGTEVPVSATQSLTITNIN